MSCYTYRTDPRVTFNSRNSNYEKAKQMSEMKIRKLIKQNKLNDIQAKIQEKINIGTLQQVSPEELQNFHTMEHHYTYFGVVSNENSNKTHQQYIVFCAKCEYFLLVWE